jgi:Mitochondrial ribosomal subunit protein
MCICVMQLAGKRYNPNTGVIRIACDRHRAREENRRQALHWALRLVESALKQYPSEEWEHIKSMQSEALKEIDEPAPCPFASFMDIEEQTPPIIPIPADNASPSSSASVATS